MGSVSKGRVIIRTKMIDIALRAGFKIQSLGVHFQSKT